MSIPSQSQPQVTLRGSSTTVSMFIPGTLGTR